MDSNTIIARALGAVLRLFLLLAALFICFKLLPGTMIDGELGVSSATNKWRAQQLGLHQSLSDQFFNWVVDLFSGQWGTSWASQNTRFNADIVKEGLKFSGLLGAFAIIVSTVLGFILGLSSLRNKRILFLILDSVPTFFFVCFLVWLWPARAVWLGSEFGGSWFSLLLPLMALSLRPTLFIARLVDGARLEQLKSPYYVFARARGAPRRVLVYKHLLKSCAASVVAVLPALLAQLLMGSFVVESMFALPGLASVFLGAIRNRDQPLVLATSFVFGLFVLITSELNQWILTVLDPRSRTTNL